jgi:hypothetical protein
MAINFPGSPTDQQIYTDTVTGNKFIYYSTPGVWKNISYTSGYNKVTISSTAPSSPSNGDWWFYQDAGELYIYYNNSQWITATGGGGINNANNALTANNASYLGGVAAASYINTASISSYFTNYAVLSGAAFTGNVSTSANLTVTGIVSITGNSAHTGTATFANTITVTGNATFSNTTTYTGAATFSNTVTITGGITGSTSLVVGNTTTSNTSYFVGNSTANATMSATSIVVANATATTTINPGTISSSNTTLSGITTISAIFENASVNATAITGAQTIDILTTPTIFYSSSSAGNWTVNVRGNSSTTLNSILSNNQSISVNLIVNQGGTAYYPTAFSIDGTSTTVKWFGGTTPSSGDVSSINLYSYTIFKTGTSAYTVFGSVNKYA